MSDEPSNVDSNRPKPGRPEASGRTELSEGPTVPGQELPAGQKQAGQDGDRQAEKAREESREKEEKKDVEKEKEKEKEKEEEKKEKKGKKKKKKKKKKNDSLGTSRGIETLFRSQYRVNMDLSALADTKSNIMISINGIIISIILASISPKIDANPFLLIPTVILLIGCLVSMVYAVLAARPRVKSQVVTLDHVRKNRANILFFGNFASMAEDEYLEGMTELLRNTDLVYKNMIRDTYGLGKVLIKKYRLLRVSYTVFMFALIVGVLSFVWVLIKYQGTALPL